MTVSTIASIAASITRTTGSDSAKGNAALTNILAASAKRTPLTTDTSPAGAAISLQNQVAQFRVASQDVAQAGTALATASLGSSEISRNIARLQDIAARAASGGISAAERAQLNGEFQAIRARLDAIASQSNFTGSDLSANGAAQPGEQQPAPTLVRLDEKTLFKGATLDVTTQENAQVASEALAQANDTTNQQIAAIQQLQEGLEQVANSLQIAIQNREAANSTLDESDFAPQVLAANGEAPQREVEAPAVQTNKLPSSLLQLLSE